MPFFGGATSAYILLGNGNIRGGTGSLPLIVATTNNIALGYGSLLFSAAANNNIVLGDSSLINQYDSINDVVAIGNAIDLLPSGVGQTAASSVIVGSGAVGASDGITIGYLATGSPFATVIGRQAIADTQGVALGNGASATSVGAGFSSNPIAIMGSALDSIAIGGSSSSDNAGIAIGNRAQAQGKTVGTDSGGIAIGDNVFSLVNEINIGDSANKIANLGGLPVKRLLHKTDVQVNSAAIGGFQLLYTFTLPANTVGNIGELIFEWAFSGVASAATVYQMRIGGVSVASTTPPTVVPGVIAQGFLSNNSGASKAITRFGGVGVNYSQSILTGAIDFTVNQSLDIYLQKGAAGDAIAFEYLSVYVAADN